MAEKTEHPGSRPLEGIRVLDFTRVLSGPFCTALLADLGAEVIKIEGPDGDEYRHVGPFKQGESALFTLMNRGKKSVALDLKQPAARDAVLRLVRFSDVVVENFKPGVTTRLGIDYAALSAVRPDLVYASISGFGQTGPLADRPAFDLIVQAMSGLMDITGEADGEPTKVGEPIADLSAGLYASWAILAALLRRACSGEGAHLDVSMFDCVFSLMPTAVAKWMFTGETLRRVGNRHPLSTPFGAFRAEDGLVVIAVLNDAQFGRLAAAMGRPDLAADPRFGSDTLRTDNEPALRALIESWTRRRPVGEVVAELSAAAVPAAPIASIAEVIESPQVAERGLLLRQMHPRLGETAVMEQPVHFAGLGRGGLAAAPLLGADDVDVLGGLLGLDAAEVAAISRRSA